MQGPGAWSQEGPEPEYIASCRPPPCRTSWGRAGALLSDSWNDTARGGASAGGRARTRLRGVSRGGASAARRGAALPAWRCGSAAPASFPAPALPGPMYRALYAFRSAEPNALAFAAGETFLVLERSSAHWWLAARARSGETGYVPPAYLRRLQVSAPLPARPLRPCGRTPSQPRGTDPGTPPIPGPEARTSIREGV